MKKSSIYIGLDVSDRFTQCHVMGKGGAVLREMRVPSLGPALLESLSPWPGARIALEAGTHSGWMTRLLREAGFAVVVADSRQLPLIYANVRKSDRNDARSLAQVLRLDERLLGNAHVRGAQAQADLSLVKARDALVRARTSLISTVRGIFKSLGHRAPAATACTFAAKTREALPEILAPCLTGVLESIQHLTEQIKDFDKKLELLCQKRYPHTELLRSIPGIGPVTALTYALVIEDPSRFSNSRDVGAYLGLTSRRDQSGERDPQLPITKAGNALLRRLLVQAAHYVLGPFGPPSHLRDWGLAKAGESKRAKRKAIVALARKLAVLMHSLWVNGACYEPYYATQGARAA